MYTLIYYDNKSQNRWIKETAKTPQEAFEKKAYRTKQGYKVIIINSEEE